MARKSWLLALGVVPAWPPAWRPRAPRKSSSAITASPPTACRIAVALAKGFFKQQGADVTGILSSDGGGTTVRTHARRQSRLWRDQSDRDRDRDPAGRRSQDRQRQCADGRGIHLGGEAEFADQDRRRPEGQEDRLHQSALDQPGAGDPGAGEGRPEARATPSWSRPAASARASSRSISARSTSRRSPSRSGRSIRASIARWCGRATCCRRSTMWSASPPQGRRGARRFHPRRDPRAPPGGRVHVCQSGRVRRHHRQGLQSLARGGAQRGAQSARQPRQVRRALLERGRDQPARP